MKAAVPHGHDIHAEESEVSGIDCNGGHAGPPRTGRRPIVGPPESPAPEDVAPHGRRSRAG